MPEILLALLLMVILWPGTSSAAAGDADADTANAAPAGQAPSSMFSYGGFGTFGVVHSSESQADFTNIFQANGAGYTRSWSPTVDSLIAGQITANFTSRLSAVVQVIAQQNYNDTYWPHLEWANIKYQFTPDFSVRLGRTELPFFIANDSRKIGFANPWVRPPIEVYRLAPVTSSDGIDASYRLSLGTVINTFQINVGRNDTKFSGGNNLPDGTSEARQLLAFIDTFEYGFLTVHATLLRARLTVAAFNPLFDGFRQFGPQGIAIADRYALIDRKATFVGIGANYDPGQWFAMSEWGHFNSNSIAPEAAGWYVSGGYRLGKFTPYATYAEVEPESNTSDPGLDLASLPPDLAAAAAGLNGALNVLLASAPSQRTISLGARWDFMRNFDAKLQLDHSHLGSGSPGLLVNLRPGFQPGGTVNLLSATIDFVF